MQPTPEGYCTHSTGSPRRRPGTGSTSTPSPSRTWQGRSPGCNSSGRSPWGHTREGPAKANSRRGRWDRGTHRGGPPQPRRTRGHAPGGERPSRRQEPAHHARRATDGHRPLARHLPRCVGGAAATLGRNERRRARAGGRRTRAPAATRSRQVLLSGRGLLAAGREGASLARGVGAVRRCAWRPRAGGHAAPGNRPARPEYAARAAAALEGLRLPADYARLPRRIEVAPGRIEGGHRHPHFECRGSSRADSGALREYAGDHGEGRGVGAGGRRLRDGALSGEARESKWGGAEDGRAGGEDLPLPGDDGAWGVPGGRGRERAGRGRPGALTRARQEGPTREALLLGSSDLRDAPRGAPRRRCDARGRAAFSSGGAVPETGGRRGAGGDHGLRQLLSDWRGVPEL